MSQSVISPGLADVPVAESAVSFIDGKNARLEYRGIAVERLARKLAPPRRSAVAVLLHLRST